MGGLYSSTNPPKLNGLILILYAIVALSVLECKRLFVDFQPLFDGLSQRFKYPRISPLLHGVLADSFATGALTTYGSGVMTPITELATMPAAFAAWRKNAPEAWGAGLLRCPISKAPGQFQRYMLGILRTRKDPGLWS